VEPLFLSLEEVLEIHHQQIDRYGGASGVRDLALLESAIAQPQASFSNEFLHASIPAMAAAYLFHICCNHPFVDGNKRVAANAAITFLLINDWEPTFTEDALVDTVLAVASSSMTKEDLVRFFQAYSVPLANTHG
jgi:death-on-curing protein